MLKSNNKLPNRFMPDISPFPEKLGVLEVKLKDSKQLM
jgi:hypothetical protein